MTISCIVSYQGQDDTTKYRTLQKGSWSSEQPASEQSHIEESASLPEGCVGVYLVISKDTEWELVNTALTELRKTGRVDADEYLLNKIYGQFGVRHLYLGCLRLCPHRTGVPTWTLFERMKTEARLCKEITDCVVIYTTSESRREIYMKWAEELIRENTDTLVLQLKPSPHRG